MTVREDFKPQHNAVERRFKRCTYSLPSGEGWGGVQIDTLCGAWGPTPHLKNHCTQTLYIIPDTGYSVTMMMEWSAAYELGDPSLDNHHQELFLLTSRLDAAIQTGDSQQLDDIIVFLETYVVSHFNEEESVMHHHHYTGYDMHRSEHDVLKFKVGELRKWFQGNVPKAHLIFGIRRTVDALMTHIRLVDVGIADIVKDHEAHP